MARRVSVVLGMDGAPPEPGVEASPVRRMARRMSVVLGITVAPNQVGSNHSGKKSSDC